MYDLNNERAAITALQRMLNEITSKDENTATIYVDGIYGKETAKAVRDVQGRNSLNVTGSVDFETFNCIVDEYNCTKNNSAHKAGFYPDVLKDGVLCTGDECTAVVVIQTMLHELSYIYEECEGVKLNGIFDKETEDTIKKIQSVHQIEENGKVDTLTWNALTIEYDKFRNKD